MRGQRIHAKRVYSADQLLSALVEVRISRYFNYIIIIMSRLPPIPDYVFKSDKGEVTALEFGVLNEESSMFMFTGHHTGDLQIWDLNTYRAKFCWNGHENERILWVGWLPASNCLLSQGRDRIVKIWEFSLLQTPKHIDSFICTNYSHCACDVTVKAPFFLAVPQDESDIHIVALDDRKVKFKLKANLVDHKVGALICCKLVQTLDEHLLVLVGYEIGSIILWSLRGEQFQPVSILNIFKDPVLCLDVDCETMRGIAGGIDEQLVVWEIDSSQQLRIKRSVKMPNAGAVCARIHPKALYVAVGSLDNRLRIYSWKSMKPLAVLDVHFDKINCLAYSRHVNKVLLAAGAKDGRISIWNLYADKILNKVENC